MNRVLSTIAAGALTAVLAAGSASAALLTGTFTVDVGQRSPTNTAGSAATDLNFPAILDTFVYTGALNFGTFDGSDDTTIEEWLATGGGTVTDLDAGVADNKLSAPSISNGTALATFFRFTINLGNAAGTGTVRHDDGFTVYDDGVASGSFSNPTTVRTTNYTMDGSGAGEFKLVYVATNGDPSVLRVSAVPLPAAGLLLVSALGGFGYLARRRRAAA